MGLMVSGVQSQLAIELADTITAVSNQLAKEFGDSSEDMREGIGRAVDAAVSGFADVLDGAATVVDFIDSNPMSAKFGVLGWVLLGPKGALIASAIGAVFDQIEEGLAKFGAGISQGEDNARKLLNIQEQIALAQERLAVAGSIGNTQAQEEARKQLEALRERQAELQTVVDSSSEAQARYNELLNQGTSAADGFAGGLRRTGEALRDSLGGGEDGESPEEENEKELERNEEHNQKLLEQRKLWAERMTALDKRANAEQADIVELSSDQKRDAIAGALGDVTSLMNTESRKQFEIGKAAALGQAVIDGYAAIVGAYKQGASIGGPVLGAAFASAAGAATFAQIQAIRSQSFQGGGGGSAAGGGGGTPTQNVNAQTEQISRTTSVDISLIGADSRDRAVAGSVIEQINDEIDRGGRISRVGLA